jgi:hypothetical protein
MNRRNERILLAIVVICVLLFLYDIAFQASNDRTWNRDQEILARATFDGDLIHVENIRNNTYRSTTDFDVRHYDATYNLSEIQGVWFMVEPFAGWGAAHTLVSFEFPDHRYLAISVEIRKEQGESFSAVKGLFRQYELMYVVADEEDVIKLRSNHRKDIVYLYRANTTPERARAMLTSMLSTANDIAEHPRFYHTVTSTCTTNIVRHVNIINPGRVRPDWRILAPKYVDAYAMEIGLLDVDEPTIEEARLAHRINDRAMDETLGPFSERIRE